MKRTAGMMKFLTGLMLGLVLGAATVGAAASCIGSGYARGWTVTKDGDEICDSPYIRTSSREIECD
jgi:hypothetical protein